MITIILGTRPEIIKCCSIIKELQSQKIPYTIIHTNQHYDINLDSIFFQELELPSPHYRLFVPPITPLIQIATMLIELEKKLKNIKPDIILVEGDTNTVQAASLAASKLHIPLGHIEAGLRSYDERMPEEWNRIICDHLSQLLFAPTRTQKKILLSEGIQEQKIHVVGNTIADAVYYILSTLQKGILHKYCLQPQKYFLVTFHRPENVDNTHELQQILQGLELLHKHFQLPLLFPIHPRTQKQFVSSGLKLPSGVRGIAPLGYFDFLALERDALLIVTDSGGVQEEACILKVPCVTTRISTERPETVEVGANCIAGTQPQNIFHAVQSMITKKRVWDNPYGNGTTGKKIVDICKTYILSHKK